MVASSDKLLVNEINLSHLHHSVVSKNAKLFDPVRKIWIKAQPEEWVRQLWIRFLMDYFPIGFIAVEKSIPGLHRKRFDILVYDRALKPHLLVELKAPNYQLSDNALLQVRNYQSVSKAPYFLMSNGQSHQLYFFDVNQEFIISQLVWPFSKSII